MNSPLPSRRAFPFRAPRLPAAAAAALLATLVAGALAGCGDRMGQAGPAIAPRPERPMATFKSEDPATAVQRFLPLSEQPSPAMLIARVLAEIMPPLVADGLPAQVERARGEVPNMARPMRYSVFETLAIGADGRVREGAVEIIDDDYFAGDGYFIFTFRPDGEIAVQGIQGDLPGITWKDVATLLAPVVRRVAGAHPGRHAGESG